MSKAKKETPCDKCEQPNDVAEYSNYCSKCREGFQKQCAESYKGLSGYNYNEKRNN